jgi:hypothetical protein
MIPVQLLKSGNFTINLTPGTKLLMGIGRKPLGRFELIGLAGDFRTAFSAV